MIEKLQLIKKTRFDSFLDLYPEEKNNKVKNLPESLLGAYLQPKYKSKKPKNLIIEIPKLYNRDKGPIEVLTPQPKTLITCITNNRLLYSTNNNSISREYLVKSTRSNLDGVYDPYANNSLKRKRIYKYSSLSGTDDIVSRNVIFN